MAVEARHLHLFSPQPLLKSPTTTTSSREFVDGQYMYNAPMAAFVDAAPIAAAGYVVPSESGLTVVAGDDLSRKRPRGTTNLENIPPSHVHPQQMAQFDRLVVQHDEKVRAEMMERRRFAKQVMAAVEERVSKRLRAKDEEIEQISKLNWAMEEKIKSLATENQVWRYLAQTNEAAANALRTNLEQLLLAEQLRAKELDHNNSTSADDAESCCGDNFDDHRDDDDGGRDGAKTSVGDWRKLCRNCCADQPSVLLMPCQHLCLCTSCASTTNACPICKCCKTGSVHVNLSQ
ncbi:putative BOI-related E3 ubiquitin-protein ligase 3 [Iris pallida]|uniref:BOI-related E3 ubiquitin-protein ligase 3 n=1 Tax=Iris pallida TaxID=29817 RepID=A0AAX6I1L5_IRIPA|nr:putative BOI-related E3 ubiquitin-protein ligase 3 [Iris pallida]